MVKKIRVGMDFDGCLNRIPFPLSWLSRHLSYDFYLPNFCKEILFNIIVRLPVILDGRLLEIPKDVQLYVITGRKDPERVINAMKPYHIKVLARGSTSVSELEWKITTAKMYQIDYFFDDRLKIIRGLKKANIDAHDIKELIK